MEKQNLSFSKILVNLLPQEVILERKQSSKLAFLNRLSMVTLIALVFFTSATLTLRIIQSNQLKGAQDDLVLAQTKVTGLKSREDQITALKQRINSIQNIMGGDSKRKELFNLLLNLTPMDVQISDIAIDKAGNTILVINSYSLASIDTFLSNLGSKEKNSDLIGKIDLNGLSITANSIYRLDLKLTPK